MTIIAPNTKITPEYIDKNIILCCGEDTNELIDSLKKLSFEGTKVHEYRYKREIPTRLLLQTFLTTRKAF
ncbi:hypothetical protein DSM106972_014650 [Dulcicalothrix desertica PCC 7102]|uniref:Uncharacterized protein n=1 Tax=Dulcicalothrix desertica PCC 7102 TaxID=232991 RepID=A0A433VQD0_9CYAN|nr:hypothetical protein [Dulcicalothrix desertica]RUT08297.1 hypothetical protein DSM106972_014650 [Dulcicalothrix desertica PCC 7102]TWH40163.1 hypothetical protein CAL7102_09464 [Dulcicalothrix desertica PCC 7102]